MKLQTIRHILLSLTLTLSSRTSAQTTASTFTTSLSSSATTTSSTSTTTPRPIYAIAHRVLTPSSLTAALTHGANALEIDLTAHKYGWYADHDNTLCSARSTAEALFNAIASAHTTDKSNPNPISFVWLDIKNPDECDPGRACSIEALRDLARDVLLDAGIAVLYGFYAQETSRGFQVLSGDLWEREAVVLSGDVRDVVGWFDEGGSNSSDVKPKQRVMDYGAVELTEEGFGTCDSTTSSSDGGDDEGVCSVLKQGSQARDDGQIGSVMAWTTDEGEGWMVEKMLGEAGVDGIIYGLSSGEYADEESVLAAYLDIEDYVQKHPDEMRMATAEDVPW
ncbi:uncharacterized protein LDX57_007513 [Aspergillus melleus]|uniref:uncharacterized protein n=1 Tax=Aspergillus melleus TaxID=138277 RepID=UPI001E8EB81F|nr:uncharacterized protein LDX57_007513 [Aspergillus melleus]KAH8429842.1 hypothetical protein LDX57_007513 [Aspergillus melleus]